MFQGSINQAYVHPRQVVKRAIANNAASLILKGYVARKIVTSATKHVVTPSRRVKRTPP
jgi:DNA repair protein RadC